MSTILARSLKWITCTCKGRARLLYVAYAMLALTGPRLRLLLIIIIDSVAYVPIDDETWDGLSVQMSWFSRLRKYTAVVVNHEISMSLLPDWRDGSESSQPINIPLYRQKTWIRQKLMRRFLARVVSQSSVTTVLTLSTSFQILPDAPVARDRR